MKILRLTLKFYMWLVLVLISTTFSMAQQDSLNTVRKNVVKTAEYYLFVREIKYNRSPEIDSFNIAVGVPVGSSYCASFAVFVYNKNNVINPNSAYSPNFGKSKDIIWKPKLKYKINAFELILPGDAVTYYYPNLGRIGHVGIIKKIDKDGYLNVFEGNTSGSGSIGINRDGDGVFLKKRDPDKIYGVSRYIK